MVIDLTVELAPILWGMVVLLVVATIALAASIDPAIAEVYVGDRGLLVAAAIVVMVAVVALAAFEPDIARALRSP